LTQHALSRSHGTITDSESPGIPQAVDTQRPNPRSEYTLREQSLTFQRASDRIRDPHLRIEMQAAAEIVGSRTYVDLVTYEELVGHDQFDGCDDGGCAVRWLDELWTRV